MEHGHDTRLGDLEGRVIAAMTDSDELANGEIVVHFDLVAETRRMDAAGEEHLKRHHFAIDGADPHMSWGVLQAAADKVRSTL